MLKKERLILLGNQFLDLMIKLITLLIFCFINLINLNINAEGFIKAQNGIEWDSGNQSYTAVGSVIFKNDKIEAISDKMIANYIEENEQEVFTIVEFFKNISIYFNDEVFKGDYAIYDKDQDTIKLVGNVSIDSPTRLLKGDELIVDLKNNRRTLNSNNNDSVVEVFIENNANN